MRRTYDASRTYPADQIERGAVGASNLDPSFLVVGHAVFLEPADFDTIYGALPHPMTFKEARADLWRELGSRQSFDPAKASHGEAEERGLQALSSHESEHYGGAEGGNGSD